MTSVSGSSNSRISTYDLKMKLESLKTKRTRNSTYMTFFKIWSGFNKFLIQLDYIPKKWEERTVLYCAHLINCGAQSSTIRSYISAIKAILQDDNYKWNEELVMFGALTRACRLINDKLTTQLPIHCKLLELILFEVDRFFLNRGQEYLRSLYQTLFLIGYYGLFRIGELVNGSHTIKAKNVHVAKNKKKN